jgi:hypothetical protein
LLRWVGILGSVVWLGDLLPPFGWHEGGCADHRVRADRRDLIASQPEGGKEHCEPAHPAL